MTQKYINFHLAHIKKLPQYDEGVLFMDRQGFFNAEDELRSCLIYNNGSKNDIRLNHETALDMGIYLLQTKPKWGMSFFGEIVDLDTGELVDATYQTTDLESGIKRKRKAIKSFTDFYEPLYQQRKVSCLFFTLTQANNSTQKLNITLKAIKKRFEAHKLPVKGTLWVSEISSKGHWHYHLAIVIPRVYWKAIPKWAKVDDLWGRRTQIQFIKKSIGAYLGKYIGKDNMGRMINFRAYGKSRNFLE